MTQPPRPLPAPAASTELASALGACKRAFLAIALFSGMSNILMLTGALFMLEVYDRVLPSRSVPTLVALLILAAGLYVAQGLIDADPRPHPGARRQQPRRGAERARLRRHRAAAAQSSATRAKALQPLRDLDAVRAFLSGSGPVALFDLPWMPVYLAICFVFHPYIGLTALVGAVILITLTILTGDVHPPADSQRDAVRHARATR